MTCDGDVSFGNSLVSQFAIGGTQLGEYDRSDIAGNLFLDGLLQVELINGFQLGLSQDF